MTSDVPRDISQIKPADLPAPPQTAARIVQACGDPEVGSTRLAKIVAVDPVLTAEILRTVNSAFFMRKRKVISAQDAVTVLGNRSLRSIALCFAVRDAVRPNAIPGLDMVSYWEDALRRGVAARLLGQKLRLDPEEAFTVGLLQDFGILAMFFAQPDKAVHWKTIRPLYPEERREKEREIFGTTHDRIGLLLARTWALPEEIAVPIAYHHASSLAKVPLYLRNMCKIATAADWVCSVFVSPDKRKALDRVRAYLVKPPFSMSLKRVDDLLSALPPAVEEVATTLGLRVEEQTTFEEVLQDANRKLAQETMSYQELTWALEQALGEKERLAQELLEVNGRLEQLAYYDPLTNLANRRRFLEASLSEILRHSRSGKALSLIVLDLDHFKRINDSFGHPFGDAVLQAVARTMQRVHRTIDIKARIGGEEMCVLFPETDMDQGKRGAERLRQALEDQDLATPTHPVKVTASIGGITWKGNVANPREAGQLLKKLMDTADAALYAAKNGGRNQVVWAESLLDSTPS